MRLRPEIEQLPPYRQGKPADPSSFKLSSNENPFDPLPSVLNAIDWATINRYPDALASALRARLAERHGLAVGRVHVGSGSVAVIAQLLAAAATVGDEVIFSWRSFEAYPSLTTVNGATPVPVANSADHRHDLTAMAAAVTERTRAIFVCSPNNPTGTVVTAEEFEAFMARVPADVLVVLDEAYAEFVTDPGAVRGHELLERHQNLVVLRTFSKAYGLAGLRVGYALGPEYVMDALRSTAIPLSVTAQAEQAAIASLDASDELLERTGRITMLRDQLWQALVDQGWQLPRSQANFLWLPTGERTAEANARLEAAGIIARPFIPDGIRVSIGESASVDKLLRVAAEVVRTQTNSA